MTKNFPEEFEKWWEEESGVMASEKITAEEAWDAAFELGKWEGLEIAWKSERAEENIHE